MWPGEIGEDVKAPANSASSARRSHTGLAGGLVAILLAGAVGIMLAPQGQAQKAFAISAPAIVTAQPTGQVALPIRIEPAGALPRNSIVRVRGLPPMAALSDGYTIGAGAWAVPLSALDNLKISLPATASGRFEIVIVLVDGEGSILVEAKSVLTVAHAQAPSRPAERAASPPAAASILRAGVPIDTGSAGHAATPSAAPILPRTTPADKERAMRLIAKGNEQLDEGNIAAARLFYERAAEAGLAEGAMALGATFDAVELAHRKVRGISADNKQARRWYERARELGASEAEARLKRLGTN
jgi:hypothetical protein